MGSKYRNEQSVIDMTVDDDDDEMIAIYSGDAEDEKDNRAFVSGGDPSGGD